MLAADTYAWLAPVLRRLPFGTLILARFVAPEYLIALRLLRWAIKLSGVDRRGTSSSAIQAASRSTRS
jgi:hypothetical protein